MTDTDEIRSIFREVAYEVLHEVIAEIRVEEPEARPTGLLSTRDAMAILGKSAGWVRQHRDKLGVVYIGEGQSKPRLHFPAERIYSIARGELSVHASKPELPKVAKPRRRRRSTSAPLLEIRGDVA